MVLVGTEMCYLHDAGANGTPHTHDTGGNGDVLSA